MLMHLTFQRKFLRENSRKKIKELTKELMLQINNEQKKSTHKEATALASIYDHHYWQWYYCCLLLLDTELICRTWKLKTETKTEFMLVVGKNTIGSRKSTINKRINQRSK